MVVVVAAMATPVLAEPVTVGANLGVVRQQSSTIENSSIGLFARLGVERRVSFQLELARLQRSAAQLPSPMPTPGDADTTQATGMVVVDLDDGSLAPTVLAGLGADHASNIVRDNTYAHGELGVGLELRMRGGLVLGADARVGMRRILASTQRDILVTFEPPTLPEGTYRSARVNLGFRF